MSAPRSNPQPRDHRKIGTVRLSDVATAAAVSPALASRILNNDPQARASETTRERIRDAARRLGYVPNVAAQSLRKSRTGLIGLVVHDLSSPIYLELMRGAREEAAEHDHFLLLGDVDELLEDERAYRLLVNGRRVDGIILQGGHSEFDQRAGDIASVMPTIVVNAPGDGTDRSVPRVYPDELAATRLLADHLIALGHRRIAFLSGPRDSMTSQLRQKGLETALQSAGLSLLDEDVVHADWSAEGGRAGFEQLLARWQESRPTALLAGNSLIGVGVLGAAAQLGVSVPTDMSVAAIHDMWISEHTVPALTTVSLPLHEVGVVAVRMLLDWNNAPADRVLEHPPVLHARSSTAPPSSRR